jgi:hypothetical protein
MRALFCTISLLSLMAGGVAHAETGKLILDARLRYEYVDQEGIANTADAATLRAHLGYETPAFHGFKGLIEAESVIPLVEDYNSTTNGKTSYPIVADPEGTELNRAQISWTGKSSDVVLGRQRLILNNARFIGNVGFRQNEQTFDALKASYKPTKDITLTYAYLDRVHRIFGDDSAQGEWNSDSHIAQVDAKTPIGMVSVYGHALDFSNAPSQSLSEAGVRLTGSHPIGGGFAATYEGEYARQSDYADNPASFDLSYAALALGVKKDATALFVGVERLEGDGARGFQTPLATLHAFQGWADVFLTTPATGVRDVNLNATTAINGPHEKPVKLQIALHDFADSDGSTHFGKELDAAISTPLTKHISAELKAATFAGDTPTFADRTKVWMTLEYKF